MPYCDFDNTPLIVTQIGKNKLGQQMHEKTCLTANCPGKKKGDEYTFIQLPNKRND